MANMNKTDYVFEEEMSSNISETDPEVEEEMGDTNNNTDREHEAKKATDYFIKINEKYDEEVSEVIDEIKKIFENKYLCKKF